MINGTLKNAKEAIEYKIFCEHLKKEATPQEFKKPEKPIKNGAAGI